MRSFLPIYDAPSLQYVEMPNRPFCRQLCHIHFYFLSTFLVLALLSLYLRTSKTVQSPVEPEIHPSLCLAHQLLIDLSYYFPDHPAHHLYYGRNTALH